MNTKVLNRICITVFTLFFLSCSKDEEEFTIDENADFSILSIGATEINVNLNYAQTGVRSLAFGLRKKGESEFNVVDGFGNLSSNIDNLEPAQGYELTYLVQGSDELPYKIVEFATLPWDYGEAVNSLTYSEYTYSEVGFEHEYNIEIYNSTPLPSPDKFELFLEEIGGNNQIIELPFEIQQNKLTFRIPKREQNDSRLYDIIDYTLKYRAADGGSEGTIRYSDERGEILRVHPNLPYFTSIEESRTLFGLNQCSDKAYELVFKGNVFGNTTIDANYGVEEVTLKLLNVSNNEEIVLTEGDLFENCNTFTRLESNSSNTLNSLHWPNREVKLRFKREIDLGITEGDYTIQCVAKVNGDVIVGKAFPFVLEDTRSIVGFTKTLRKLLVNGVDRTQELLDTCELKESFLLEEDGTLKNTIYVPNGTMDCVVAEIKNGTWVEEPMEGDLKKYTLNIEAGLTEGEKQITAYLEGNFTFYFEEERQDGQGGTEVYRYIFR